jgi:flavin reductase (DIM6/NTAB) family NADH-FMN oxidoreductase RutF
MLSDQQEQLARCFATSSEERYEHFCYASYRHAATGSPVIGGVLAFIDARIVAEYPGGDHAIFVGQVEAMGIGNQVAFRDTTDEQHSTLTDYEDRAATVNGVESLTYYRGQYRHLAPDYQRPGLAAQTKQSHVIIR